MLSTHTLTQRARRVIRLALSNLADEYEKIYKKAEEKLDDEKLKADAKAKVAYLVSLRITFADPGTVEEMTAAQEELFGEHEPPFQKELRMITAGAIQDEVDEAMEADTWEELTEDNGLEMTEGCDALGYENSDDLLHDHG